MKKSKGRAQRILGALIPRSRGMKIALLIALLFFLLLFNVILPIVGLRLANQYLADNPNVKGHIEAMRFHILQPGVSVFDTILVLPKQTFAERPLAKIPRLKATFSWTSLLTLNPALTVKIDRPQFHIDQHDLEKSLTPRAKEKVKEKKPEKVEEASEKARALPIDEIASFKIYDGSFAIALSDAGKDPVVHLAFDKLNMDLEHVVLDPDREVKGEYARLHFTTYAIGGGSVELTAAGDNFLSRRANLDVKFKMDDFQIAQLNTFYKEVANVDVAKGKLDLYAEAKANKGLVKGYVKPLLKGFDVANWKRELKSKGFFNLLWESIVEAAVRLFENPKKDQVAARIPFEGRLDAPNVGRLDAIMSILRNAFPRAITPGFER